MFRKGFSQLPVRDRVSNSFMGIVTELSILRRIMMPNEKSVKDLLSWSKTSIDEAEVIDDVISLAHNTLIAEVAENLMRNPAILLTKLGGIVGIVTRADILRYLFDE
jgi:predicted transcriptional regulator